ncbi:MAG: ParB N-terminal domain-containing protein [Dinoroseobacter sp.]|nr:ParB N-terminal domain-containing protein [Dinoroseobacter sp.]
MAKRKRLSPSVLVDDGSLLRLNGHEILRGETGSTAPPIAQVAREASASAALEEVTAELASARAEGRLIQTVPLAAIERDYLVRDRIVAEDEEMTALKASLAARGQQTPVELVDLGQGAYGLISGWRRLAALEALLDETGEDRFAHVQALLRQPETAGDAYTAMVEENEIRVGLSPFERGRIVAKAVEQGVFPDTQTALRALFASASRAKRSKIGSFIRVVGALDGVLRFPGAIGERLGLRLAKALDADPETAVRLQTALRAADPQSAEAEAAVLEQVLRVPQPSTAATASELATDPESPGVAVTRKGQRLVLSGAGVSADLETRLRHWLMEQGFMQKP